MKKNYKYIILLLILVLSLTACKDKKLITKSEELGISAMESGNYEKAYTCFQIAVDEGTKNEEIKNLYEIFSLYNESKDLIKKDEYELAKKTIFSIEKDYKEYEIGKDIETLKSEIVEYEDVLENYKKVNGYIDVYDIKSTREILPNLNARYDMLYIKSSELKNLHREVNEKVYIYEQNQIAIEKEKEMAKNQIMSVSSATNVLVKKKGIDLNFRFIEYMPDMDEVVDGVKYYCFDDRAIESGAANTYIVNSKTGDVYDYNEFVDIYETNL